MGDGCVAIEVHGAGGVVLDWHVLQSDFDKRRPECRSCGDPILWATTDKDRRNPLNPEPDDQGIYTSHFATCPNAGRHRRRR